MLDEAWSRVLELSETVPLLRSPVFFLLLASVVTLGVNLFFSAVDLVTGRVRPAAMIKAALPLLSGLVPFLAMYWTGENVVSCDLPRTAPTMQEFVAQFAACLVAGDFSHYLAHRLLHSHRFLRQNVHNVHHEYEGHLYSWVGAQVHPVEAVLINAAIYWPFVLLAHPLVTWFMAVVATVNATIAHSGYDGGPFQLGNLLPLGLTTDDHQLHQDVNATKNFGNILRLWDRVFGTYGENTKHKAMSLPREVWVALNGQAKHAAGT